MIVFDGLVVGWRGEGRVRENFQVFGMGNWMDNDDIYGDGKIVLGIKDMFICRKQDEFKGY